MRLCKPGFFFRLPVPFQPGEQGASSLCEEDYGLSGTLTLPQSFGDIYLGETFSCYISLCNSAPIQLSSVGLKVEVQTQLTRETLSDSSTPEVSLALTLPLSLPLSLSLSPSLSRSLTLTRPRSRASRRSRRWTASSGTSSRTWA